ncbi:MAG: HprK-related kinase A [Azonexus sp.]|nr:HprK-related kinase A [Azonexus sp.]
MRLGEVARPQLEESLRTGRFRLDLGLFNLKLASSVPEFVESFCTLYHDYQVSLDGEGFDFDIAIAPAVFWRRWIRRNANFEFSGNTPFLPMEVNHAHAMFEWGLNWAVASYFHRLLIIHAASLEFSGCGVLLSAVSGSGKSTLSAELCLQGWRLLSDELALIDSDVSLSSLVRPVSLKGHAINVIQERHSDCVMGAIARNTHKGDVAHLKPPTESVAKIQRTANPRIIVFPKWRDGAELEVTPVCSGDAALRLIDQSFNYSILGYEGFRRTSQLVKRAEAWQIEYSSLDDAREALESLVTDCA